MKNFVTHTVALFCALYFLLAGTGFNIVQYCCQGCEQEGIEQVTTQSCVSIHQYNHTQEASGCCKPNQPLHTEEAVCPEIDFIEGCSLLRIQTDIPSIDITNYNASHSDITGIIHFPAIACLFTSNPPSAATPSSELPEDLRLPASGRDILSLHAILRI